jgi:hypothetical protein
MHLRYNFTDARLRDGCRATAPVAESKSTGADRLNRQYAAAAY